MIVKKKKEKLYIKKKRERKGSFRRALLQSAAVQCVMCIVIHGSRNFRDGEVGFC